jgi:di/tricarboxylate transporter
MPSLTVQIILTFAVLLLTVVLFVSEKLRVDVVAILIMLSLPWLGLISPSEAFSGFSGNAVMSIIAVMILGAGMDRTGVMNILATKIISVAGKSEKKLLVIISSMVGVISAFMQNVGSIALFLPAVLKICRQKNISPSSLMMPLGFSAILGGTLTMVGSGPLIILNDLLRGAGLKTFGLFAVTPIGLLLLFSGVLYFALGGKRLLPRSEGKKENSSQQELISTWHLHDTLFTCRIGKDSLLEGKTREELQLWGKYHLHLICIVSGEESIYAPWRHTSFTTGMELHLLGNREDVVAFAEEKGLDFSGIHEKAGTDSGFAEMVLSPRSSHAGKSIRQLSFRKNRGVEPLLLIRGNGKILDHFPDEPLQGGDTLVVAGPWKNIREMASGGGFVCLTPLEKDLRREKTVPAIVCFFSALVLALAGFRLSLALLTGAAGMILTGVIKIDEAYDAIDWRTVFLLAGLIPLGIAMEKTGSAAFIASAVMTLLNGAHPLVLLMVTGILATLFSLFMSNVAATVLLVPLVIMIGQQTGVDPRGLALLVGVCASNSFILPTHQVNAMLMSIGGYRNRDYLRAGGLMSVLFLFVSVGLVYMFFL